MEYITDDNMSNEIEDFIINFEKMFKTSPAELQNQIKNITNNYTNNNMMPKDVKPFYYTDAEGTWPTPAIPLSNGSTPITELGNFKYLDKNVWIKKIVLINNVYDGTNWTSSSTNDQRNYGFKMGFRLTINGSPICKDVYFKSTYLAEPNWITRADTTNIIDVLAFENFVIEFDEPNLLLLKKGSVFTYYGQTLNNSNPDTQSGQWAIEVTGYIEK